MSRELAHLWRQHVGRPERLQARGALPQDSLCMSETDPRRGVRRVHGEMIRKCRGCQAGAGAAPTRPLIGRTLALALQEREVNEPKLFRGLGPSTSVASTGVRREDAVDSGSRRNRAGQEKRNPRSPFEQTEIRLKSRRAERRDACEKNANRDTQDAQWYTSPHFTE